MTARQPTGALNGLGLNNLRSDEFSSHKNLIGISRASGSRGNYQVQVGEEFAGEWFFVDVESAGPSLAPAARVMVFPFSERISTASTNSNKVSGWFKVSTDGLLTVTGTDTFGNDFTSVVRDASEKLVGWAESVSATGGFGGFGGFGAVGGPSKPQVQKLPELSGKTRLGSVLRIDPGQWAGSPTPRVRVQWLRCTKPIREISTVRPRSCATIPGATKPSFTSTSRDVGSFLSAQVIVSNASGQFRVIMKATRKVRR
jgi:hypothetical protein